MFARPPSICQLALLLACLPAGRAAAPTTTLEIRFSKANSGFWGRYIAADKTSIRSGWITQQYGANSFRILDLPVSDLSRVKGIVYAPGCAVQTFDIAVQSANRYQYSFRCDAIPQTEIIGAVSPLSGMYEHAVKIEAKYMADWAPTFFGFNDGIDTEIPLTASVAIDDQNHFRLPVPDFSKEKLTVTGAHQAEIRIWVRDQVNGRIVDQLRLATRDPKLRTTRLGGVPVESLNADGLLFTFCSANDGYVHDRFGFALRDSAGYACKP